MKVVFILLMVFQNGFTATNSTTIQSQTSRTSTTRLTASSFPHQTSSVSDKQTKIINSTPFGPLSTLFSLKSTGTIKQFSSLPSITSSTAQSPIPTSASVSSTRQTPWSTATNATKTTGTNVPTTSTSDILTRYVKIPGMASLYNALTYMTISDATTCAAECESPDEEDFRCFSFDICAGQKLCLLSEENITDPFQLTDSVGCDHYVRKGQNLKTYKPRDRKVLGKYRRMSGKYNPFSTLTYMSIPDVITCAAECESPDEEDFQCYSFDICAGKRLCSLSSENLTDSNLLVDSADCDHYSRWYGGKTVTNEISHIYPTKEPTKNTGTLVGLSIGMLAVGLIFGIGGIFFYNRCRNKKNNGYELDNFRKY